MPASESRPFMPIPTQVPETGGENGTGMGRSGISLTILDRDSRGVAREAVPFKGMEK